MITSVEVAKMVKIQHLFMILKILRIEMEGSFLNLIKGTYDKPT